MIVCELRFDAEDPNHKGFSMLGRDYYAWIPAKFQNAIPNHRLSLRKNLKTGNYELYRHYGQSVFRIYFSAFSASTIEDRMKDDVIFYTSDLKEALEYACTQSERFHGKREDWDKPCKHQMPDADLFCPRLEASFQRRAE